MSCRSRSAGPRDVVIRCSTETKHNTPVLPVFIVTSEMREVRVVSSPTRNVSMNSSSPPAHIRRGSAGPGFADLHEQGGAQAAHQLRGDDVGRLLGAPDPLAQMIEVRFAGH